MIIRQVKYPLAKSTKTYYTISISPPQAYLQCPNSGGNHFMKSPFKKPTTFEEQLAILKGRGLTVTEETHVLDILRHKNYYRLRAYSVFLEQEKDVFGPHTTFEQVETLYNFDRTLRALCMQATAAIEISLRTQFAYQAAHAANSPVPHEDESLFSGYF